MRFLNVLPVLAVVLAVGLVACRREGAEETETELTPADTEFMAPPMDTMMMDTMMMDTLHQM